MERARAQGNACYGKRSIHNASFRQIILLQKLYTFTLISATYVG